MRKTLTKELIETVQLSLAELRSRISRVAYTADGISFYLDGLKYEGELTGRNEDLLLGFGEEEDKAVALRVYLDSCAKKSAS